jgi:hypothetical protein
MFKMNDNEKEAIDSHKLSQSQIDQMNKLDNTSKPSNPKDLIGSNKIPIHLFPTTAIIYGALALLDGALKYGRSNYRAIGVKSTIYTDAINRHTMAYLEGEDIDPDSKLPHLAHVLASAAILIDAKEAGKLTDDRMYPSNYRETIDRLTKEVKRLKDLHKDKNPRHWTIADRGE